jgi:hypothetical protein
MTQRGTKLTRAYTIDHDWIMNHRRTGTGADTIRSLIKFYELSNQLIEETDLE